MFGPIKRKPKEKEDPSDKLREQQETARVYAEFVKSFQVDDGGTKAFVRGGVIDPNKASGEELNSASSKSKFYKPSSSKKSLWLPPPSEPLKTRSSFASSLQTTLRTELGRGIGGIDGLGSSTASTSVPSPSARTREIDSFLEEIKRKQELLDQRRQLRQVADTSKEESERENAKRKLELIEAQTRGRGSIPGLVEAEETTNLYLGNLASEITEEYLCQQFGKYGSIASVKIMYPRNDPGDPDRPGRRSLCGFCSFEDRASAQAAKDNLDGTEMLGQAIRIGWGKAVSKPLMAPTPLSVGVAALSGVPLSAISRSTKGSGGFSDLPPEEVENKGLVRVRVPRDRRQKGVIDLVAQYVSDDGHPLEQAIMDRFGTEGLFRFLNEIDSDEARYYRWRVYAFSQGDSLKAWKTESFQMFFGGREWVPPSREYFPESGGVNTDPSRGAKRLDEQTRDDLEDILRHLKRDRNSIVEAMVLCLDHSEAALEIAECLTESLTIERTPIDTKIARLYLLSDLLHNSCCSRQAAWAYRGAIERYLPEIFNHHHKVLKQLNGRLTIQAFKDRVMKVLRIWEEWAIYSPLFTKGLEAAFLKDAKLLQNVFVEAVAPLPIEHPLVDPNIDGMPFSNDIMTTDLLSSYPYWLRSQILEWNTLDLSNLERLCRRRGLSVSPESESMVEQTEVDDGTKTVKEELAIDDSVEDDDRNQENRKIPSYSGMRQLLIRRLIECETYWRNRQTQNAKAFAVLDKAEPGSIIQAQHASVVADKVQLERSRADDDDDIFSAKQSQCEDEDELADQAKHWTSSVELAKH